MNICATRTRKRRALGTKVGVQSASAHAGKKFKPDPAHRERAIEQVDVESAPPSHELR